LQIITKFIPYEESSCGNRYFEMLRFFSCAAREEENFLFNGLQLDNQSVSFGLEDRKTDDSSFSRNVIFNKYNSKMKKNLIIASLLFVSASTFAQHAVGSFNIQPKVGFNMATMTNSDGGDSRIGFVGGAEFEYQATPIFSITAGALYSQQGIKSTGEGVTGTIKMDYVNVPILANFYVAKGFAVKAGIQPGFLVNDKVKVEVNGTSAEVDLEKALRSGGMEDAKVKDIDFSIPVGISYENNQLIMDARYNFGVTKAITGNGESTKNNVFQITLGYKFAL